MVENKSKGDSNSDTNSLLNKNALPIKIVARDTHSLTNKVRKGNGACANVVALPLFNQKRNNNYGRPYRVLLDSGSDGDILFVRKDTNDCVPYKKRYSPQKWRTSNGTFVTNKVGDDLDFCFPEFSDSRTVKVKPDIFELEKSADPPAYDMILGIHTLVKLGVILDFHTQSITIDGQTLPMRSMHSLKDYSKLCKQMEKYKEPASTRDATKRAVRILDAKYEKADLPKVVQETCEHLTTSQRNKLLKLLLEHEELFDGTLGDWQDDPVSFRLKPGATPYHGRAFPIPKIHLETLKKEVERLVQIGVLKRQPQSEWASPTFIIPKSNGTVRFISDFREVNKRIVRTPFPIPKIATILQEMEGFTYATALDLNMGYYTIRLDGDAQKICTIILPWGKYSYLRLPMGVAGSPDIFQERMTSLMDTLDYIRVYIDDLLILSKGDFDDHLAKLREVLSRLQGAKLRVNAAKSIFGSDEIEYLGYVLTRDGIRPQRKKVSAILAIEPPKNVKDLRKFLGMVQYYRDVWEKRSHLLAPLSDLVAECGHTKETKKKGTKKRPWYWNESHQKSFDAVKAAIARDVLLAYPNYDEVFEIYTDASTRQLGAVITQNGRILAFFSRKLSDTQQKYSITELELLSIVECLKEFKGMLWGQRIKVYTDHKNLMRDALGLTCDRVYRWRLLLEEYNPEIVYIKGIDNTVADAISRLEYDPKKNVKDLSFHERVNNIATLFTHYMQKHGGDELDISPRDVMFNYKNDRSGRFDSSIRPSQSFGGNVPSARQTNGTEMTETTSDVNTEYFPVSAESHLQKRFEDTDLNDLFANISSDEEEIYPPTVLEIAEEQRRSRLYKDYFKLNKKSSKRELSKRISLVVIDDTEVLVYDKTRLVVPSTDLQSRVVQWYHHYLQHPGHTRLEETISAVMWWPSLRTAIRQHVKRCDRCQLGKKRRRQYGKLPSKIAEVVPWRSVCVDLIGPYTLKDKTGSVILDFMCLTMIDPATGWFEIIELPTTEVQYVKKGNEIVEVILDKSSACISKLFNKQWLSRYPRPRQIVYDNGSEFKLHFKDLCESYNIKRKPTTVKNPQANAILERVHGVFGDMLRTSGLEGSDDLSPETVDDFIVNAAWAIRSTHHTVLRSTPGAAVFGRDMLFDVPYLADWTEIGRRRQELVDRNTERTNKARVDYDYTVGQKVTIKSDGILRKSEDKNTGPFVITQVHTNGTVRIQRGSVSERLNIRRIDPYFD